MTIILYLRSKYILSQLISCKQKGIWKVGDKPHKFLARLLRKSQAILTVKNKNGEVSYWPTGMNATTDVLLNLYFVCLMGKAHSHTNCYSAGFLLLFIFHIDFWLLLVSQRCQLIRKNLWDQNVQNDQQWCAMIFQSDSPNGFRVNSKKTVKKFSIWMNGTEWLQLEWVT